MMSDPDWTAIDRRIKTMTLLSPAEAETRVVETARTHGGRYYLRRRIRRPRPWDEPTDLDRLYDACDRLVWSGRAYWLGQSGPGIQLTARGWEAESAALAG